MLVIFALATAFLGVATLLPFFPLSHGILRVGDFPRQQFCATAALLLLASLFLGGDTAAWRAVQTLLAIVIAVQLAHIVRYTPLWRKETVAAGPSDEGVRLRLVSANVKMGNGRYDEMREVLSRADADILVLMEVDAKWRDGMRPLLDAYPQVVDETRDNSYGMIVASRLPLEDVDRNELLTEGVPSVFATVRVPDGRAFRLFCIHPEPPVIHKGTEGRDGETGLVAFKAKECDLPVIVTGDLNDVAWSVTTGRFRRISGLLDPRIGRRIFSTFDARFPLLRWPLDHLFHSGEFRLVRMERLKPAGSDHFPVLFDLLFCREADAHSTPNAADREDIEEAKDVVGKARRRDEKPIGEDWED